MKSFVHLTFTACLVLVLSLVPAAATTQDPVKLVEQTSAQVLNKLRKDPERTRNDPDFLYGLVDDIILPILDFQGMSRLILARHWRTATPEQRERFVDAFQNTLMRTYTLQMAEHMDKDIRVLPHRSRQDERMASVATEIVMGQGRSNIPVIYSLRPVDGEWKVFDLTVEGLSFVTNFRTNFGAEVERHGLDALIERLEAGDESLIEEAVQIEAGPGR
ncbi:MlaC/ttg2D family ABC transporter substrate-binding protein [Ectothiorhodospira lacustris]|uniref:MlaC/ttg2D family ABC transporter substrate-binding protein n=1 Tax=Ectothiorhodospira lacustris TaxID=2899127 RepID=UPI001EE8C73F|nr:ABC transporter substrate-binding protein [Ectothiorhodospira lacustris]MCG5500666.1 ABC transporter substrate-binding protein [Ectothiorhodospira lacustris]MCG5509948.1 ABC transporter substrate-binding protein [Ectothiorhodospira lacustris]MCG5521202.1 ABC transporter substrate-binding protein [Ectothiorhodospira lacustris]